MIECAYAIAFTYELSLLLLSTVRRRQGRKYTMSLVRGTLALAVRLTRRPLISSKVCAIYHSVDSVLNYSHARFFNFPFNNSCTFPYFCRFAWCSVCSSRFLC